MATSPRPAPEFAVTPRSGFGAMGQADPPTMIAGPASEKPRARFPSEAPSQAYSVVAPGLLRDDSQRGAGVSFAELWPEGEQPMVREVEEAISRGRYWRAIELCETLVSRVFASAAGLFGTTDAPRDVAMVPMLLGLDGRRYLRFRSVVREARGDGLITARDALSAFAFAIDVRLARSSI